MPLTGITGSPAAAGETMLTANGGGLFLTVPEAVGAELQVGKSEFDDELLELLTPLLTLQTALPISAAAESDGALSGLEPLNDGAAVAGAGSSITLIAPPLTAAISAPASVPVVATEAAGVAAKAMIDAGYVMDDPQEQVSQITDGNKDAEFPAEQRVNPPESPVTTDGTRKQADNTLVAAIGTQEPDTGQSFESRQNSLPDNIVTEPAAENMTGKADSVESDGDPATAFRRPAPAPVDVTAQSSSILPSVTSAAGAHPLTESSPASSPQIAEQIAAESLKYAEIVRHHGEQRFTMRLDPPELGKVTVEMERTDTGMFLRVSAVDPVTASLIQASVNELSLTPGQHESVLQGLSIDVTTGDGSGRSDREEFTRRRSRMMIHEAVAPLSTESKKISFVA